MHARFPHRIALALMLLLLTLGNVLAQHPQGATTIYLPSIVEPGQTATTSPTTIPSPPLDVMQAEVVRLVNEERAKADCPAAIVHPALMSAAQEWSDYMNLNGVYVHSGTIDPEWYQKRGYPNGAAENIASGPSTAVSVIAAWMHSPLHKQTVLFCPDANQAIYNIGVGAAQKPGEESFIWTLAIGEQ